MLRNTPVVFNQRQIGLLQDACFDQTRKRVYAFVVSCGLRGKRLVPVQHVVLIGEAFILIDGFEKYHRTDKQQTTWFVRDTMGLLVGRVMDYAIDKQSMEVLAVEIVPGYGLRATRSCIWVYTYGIVMNGLMELSIPLNLSSQPCMFREGEDECGYLL